MIVESEAQIVEAVRDARERRTTLEIVGGGTRRAFGRPVEYDAVLDVSRVSGIVSYEPEELILTVKPGTPLAEIDALLSVNGQRLGFDPQDWSALLGSSGAATIGGAISCNADGPAAIRHGRARDHLLGIRAVNGFGEAYKAGGRVVKNVTGFDLPKLMCGAMGTLGPLTELTFRVFPKALRSTVYALRGLNTEESLTLLRDVWSSPLESTGLCYRFADDFAFIRLEGTADILAEKAEGLRAILGSHDGVEVDGLPSLDELLAEMEGDIWRCFVPPANAVDAIADFARNSSETRFDWIADWAGGLLWLASDADLHAVAARHGGHAAFIGASAETRKRTPPFMPEEPARAALTHAVKSAFDPLGLFNPGRMYKGV